MDPAGFPIWQQLAEAWGPLAGLILTLSVAAIWRGPAWLAAYTAHKVGLSEQDRLDRALEIKLEYLALRTRRMKAEIDGQVSAVPALQAETSRTTTRVEQPTASEKVSKAA